MINNKGRMRPLTIQERAALIQDFRLCKSGMLPALISWNLSNSQLTDEGIDVIFDLLSIYQWLIFNTTQTRWK
ncbi:hypothetical protein SAMN06297280_0105 [Arsukibacterium tuosuense]|uniref:Uncharacterized protein n=1 Tax=Arsukibacterium tuosuense TaxID=1323745 RepID=A0A285JJN0_9GAMM|nr:hypothetical protein SAMN06297280_0105 [Arsukibacterium tuosuense]